jgi:hypothetical protein
MQAEDLEDLLYLNLFVREGCGEVIQDQTVDAGNDDADNDDDDDDRQLDNDDNNDDH